MQISLIRSLALAKFCGVAILNAQFSGAIEGSVTDQSGAAVPGANVVLTGADTGVAHSTVTSGEGYFRFPSLAPGGYKLTVTAQGFGSVTQKNIELTAMRVQTVPVKMQVASAQTSVEVTAASARLIANWFAVVLVVQPPQLKPTIMVRMLPMTAPQAPDLSNARCTCMRHLQVLRTMCEWHQIASV